jgi:hypothetical protein
MKLDVYHTAVDEVRNVAWLLEDLASALEETGQTILSRRLLRMSANLKIQADAIFNAVGEDVGEMVKHAEANSAAIFRAVLAGSAIATEDKKLAQVVVDMTPVEDRDDEGGNPYKGEDFKTGRGFPPKRRG